MSQREKKPNTHDLQQITRIYNLRRLTQLPYNLIRSQQLDALKTNCLCNLEFLHAKITAMSPTEVIKDIQMALASLESNEVDLDLSLMLSFMHESFEVLSVSPNELSSQLIGRLRLIIDLDKPLAPRDPFKYPHVKSLLAQVRMSSIPVLIPSCTCLLEPSDMSRDLLADHLAPVTAMAPTSTGLKVLTASKDGTMKLWNLLTRCVIKTISDVGTEVLEIRLAMSDMVAVTSETTRIRIWDLRSGECTMVIGDYGDPATITLACEKRWLVAFYHGSFYMRVWDLQQQNSFVSETTMHEV